MNKLIKKLLQIILSVAVTFYSAFILKCLWAWYIIPWIDSVPQLNYIVAIGIMLIVKFLTYQFTVNDSIYFLNVLRTPKEDIEEVQEELGKLNLTRAFSIILVNTSFLFFGWLYHFFM